MPRMVRTAAVACALSLAWTAAGAQTAASQTAASQTAASQAAARLAPARTALDQAGVDLQATIRGGDPHAQAPAKIDQWVRAVGAYGAVARQAETALARASGAAADAAIADMWRAGLDTQKIVVQTGIAVGDWVKSEASPAEAVVINSPRDVAYIRLEEDFSTLEEIERLWGEEADAGNRAYLESLAPEWRQRVAEAVEQLANAQGDPNVIVNDALDVAHAQLEDRFRGRAEMAASLDLEMDVGQRQWVVDYLAWMDELIWRHVADMARLAGQIQVGRPPPRQPEKPVEAADERDPEELLGDCPQQMIQAVRAIDVALAELADCRAASPDNNCPRLEPPLAKAEATYEAVDRRCTALGEPIYRVSRPKADAAVAEGRAAAEAARALKADPERAGAAQAEIAREATRVRQTAKAAEAAKAAGTADRVIAKPEPAAADDDFLVPLVRAPASRRP